MKHIKTYENRISNEPQIGDYAIIKTPNDNENKRLLIIGIIYEKERDYFFIEYKPNANDYKHQSAFQMEEILFHSTYEKDCVDMIEVLKNSSKYNI
jgi:hypothetical protein